MVDSYLFARLLEAVKPSSKVVIIFDDAQLPPVGCGSAATDLLKSGLPTFCLDVIHRQSADSGIKLDAHLIRQGCWSADGYFRQIHGMNGDMCLW